ncbi:MAG: hypothetical protein ABSH50_28755 [Bryobacteraceae bacterium]
MAKPRLVWALALPVIALIVFAVSQAPVWRQAGAPAVVVLQAMRGTETTSVAAGVPLTLVPDIADLPQFPEYRIEVVNDTGHQVYRSKVFAQNSQLRSTIAGGLRRGAYFVRIYSPHGELLREYALSVRN